MCTVRFIARKGLVREEGSKLRRRISGVSIGGVPWKVGSNCLYQEGPGGATLFGTVVNMYHFKTDIMDDFIIFQLENKPIMSRMGHYCWLSRDGYTTVFALWSNVTWKCKALLLEGKPLMVLPFASCTSKELIAFN
jgi:hypothetical protein